MQQLPKLTKIRLPPERMSTEKSPQHWMESHAFYESNMLKMRDKWETVRLSLT